MVSVILFKGPSSEQASELIKGGKGQLMDHSIQEAFQFHVTKGLLRDIKTAI